ncbi:MAG TPA: nuclear transport factor 2 family protein [Steroidobacteraceae bacterium]|nr:nuclear transport factor 2 family protein [Steroidobacteraceae bacterium]
MNHSIRGGKISRRTLVAIAGAAVFLTASVAASRDMPSLTIDEKANIQTIDSFIAAWNAKDAEKVMSFFAKDARFSVGNIGKTPDYKKPDFVSLIQGASTIKMTITPGTTWARGPVVTHERVDDIVFGPDSKIAGKYIAVFTLRDGKIVDFTDYVVQDDSSPNFRLVE